MIAFDRDGVLVGVLGDFAAGHPKNYQGAEVATNFRINGIHTIPGHGIVTKIGVTEGSNRAFGTGKLYPCKWVEVEVEGTLIAYISPFGGQLVPEEKVRFQKTIVIALDQEPEFKVGQAINFEHRDAFGNNASWNLI